MKKGFTLVEILGVIVILSLIAIISYTGIVSMNRNYKEKEFEDYKKSLYMATETYININKIEINDTVYVTVSELFDGSYIDKVVENPKTEKEEHNAKVKITKDNAGVLVFEYINE